MLRLKSVSGPFSEDFKLLIISFHFMESKNLHELIPIAPSNNLLFQSTINENIQNSKLLINSYPLIGPHFFNGVVIGMLIIEHFM
jgi:hypothetical protein